MADTLTTLRHQIATLETEDGDFYVACAKTDDWPAPLTGKRFPTEQAASEAADIAREYREILRESNPNLPERQLSVYEQSGESLTLISTRQQVAGHRENGLPRTSRSVTLAGDGEHEWLRMDNAPLVYIQREGEPLPDDAIERQLDSKL